MYGSYFSPPYNRVHRPASSVYHVPRMDNPLDELTSLARVMYKFAKDNELPIVISDAFERVKECSSRAEIYVETALDVVRDNSSLRKKVDEHLTEKVSIHNCWSNRVYHALTCRRSDLARALAEILEEAK